MSKKITPPAGMTGLSAEPWHRGEIYAVAAADWTEPSSPIVQYHTEGVWGGTPYQAGSFGLCAGRSDRAALEAILLQAIQDSDGGVVGDIAAIMADAVTI